MSVVSKKKKVEQDRESGVHLKDEPGRLDIISDFKHLSVEVKKEAKAALLKARNAIVGVFANEKGQLSLFKDEPEQFEDVTEEDDERIPEDRADEIIKKAQESLSDGKRIGFEIRDGAVRIIRVQKKSNARGELGSYSK